MLDGKVPFIGVKVDSSKICVNTIRALFNTMKLLEAEYPNYVKAQIVKR